MTTLFDKLRKKLGLTEKELAAPPTELDRMAVAHRLSVESILKAQLPAEERDAMLQETGRQYAAAVSKFTGTIGPTTVPDDDDDDDEAEPSTKRITPQEDDMEQAEKDKLEKALADAVTAAATIEKLSKRLDDVATENVALKKQVDDAQAAAKERDLQKRASEIVESTGLTVEAILPLLRKADGDKDAEAAIVLLTSQVKSAQSDAELFKTLGQIVRTPTSVETEVAKRMEAMMAADPKLSRPQAMDRVLTANPDLYEKMQAGGEMSDALKK